MIPTQTLWVEDSVYIKTLGPRSWLVAQCTVLRKRVPCVMKGQMLSTYRNLELVSVEGVC